MILPLVLAPVAFVIAWLFDRRRRVYADLGTTPAAAVYAGRNEVKGRAWHAHPLRSHVTGTPSVTWSYTLEEEREHTRTVTETDSEGRTTTRTETYTEWHQIDSLSGAHSGVHVVDDSGSVEVLLGPASVISRTFLRETFREEEQRSLLERLVRLDDRTGKYRRTETGIAVGDELYVVGEASFPGDASVPRLDHGTPFIVSTRPEESHRRRVGFAVPVFLLLGAALALWGAAGFDSPAAVPVTGALLVVLFVATATVIVFNQLEAHVERAARAWSLIDVQLARRRDLIPALEAVTKAAMSHEQVAQEAVAVARSTVIGDAPDADAVARADAAVEEQTTRLRGLVALIEAHPELQADASATRLQAELADTENRIAGTRTFYNETVTLLRDKRRTFPGILVARFADPRRFTLFDAEGFERTVPEIRHEFDTSADR